ncbi:MAG: CGNR zinc finger domain-containing protein [Actinomycetota bacterium]
MEFTGYANRCVKLAVDLVNSENPVKGNDYLPDRAALSRLLRRHSVSYRRAISDTDLKAVRALRERLRGVFGAGSERAAVEALNSLLVESGSLPQLTGHDGEPWHLHFAPQDAPLAERLAAEAAMGLASIVNEHGFERLRACERDDCVDVFVDMSRNRSRRYCNPEVCGNRASVEAFRARQRARQRKPQLSPD